MGLVCDEERVSVRIYRCPQSSRGTVASTRVSAPRGDGGGTAPLPWAPVGNSAWPESRQQRELRCGKGSDCGNLLEP